MALFHVTFVNSFRSVRAPAFRGVRAANPTLKRTECECSSPTQGQNKGRGRRRRSERGGPRRAYVQWPNVGKQVRASYL